jgi:hypothetical protein
VIGPARVLLAIVVLVGAVGALGSAAKVASQALDRTRDSTTERALVPTEEALLDPRPFELAAQTIPRGDTFAVVVDPNGTAVPQIASDGAAAFAGYWLLPRRRILDPHGAQWIVAYGADLRALGIPYRTLTRVPPESGVARR